MAQLPHEERYSRVRALRDPVSLVHAALAEPGVFKAAVETLGKCQPSEQAARALVDAHDRGESESWLVAVMLGAVGHPAGYAKALEILTRADRRLSESYAADACTAIAGVHAAPDLARVIDTCTDGIARRAAAAALAKLGSPDVFALLFDALARDRLRAQAVADALWHVELDDAIALSALRSPHREVRRVVPRYLARRLRLTRVEAPPAMPAPPLRDALLEVIEQGEDVVWSADARLLREWLDAR